MPPTLTKQLDLSPENIRWRARNIVLSGIVLSCALLPLGHWLSGALSPDIAVLVPAMTAASNLILIIAIATVLMRTLGELSDDALLDRVRITNSALAESEERFRGLFETSSDAMIYRRKGADGTMQLLDVNDAYLTMFGYKRSDITPDIESGARLTPESRKRWFEVHEPALERDGFVDNMVFDGLRTDGTSFPATARVFGIRDAAGEIVATWTTLRDMSAQENAERELKESETKFRRLFETCRLGLIAWNIDADGKPQLDAVNDSVLAMYDMDMETAWDTISKMEHITRESSERWDRDHRPTLKKVGFGKDQKLVGIRSNGSHFPILIDTWYVKDEYGNVTGLWGALRDVTESEKIEQDLRLKNRALEQSSVAISILDRSKPDHYMYYTNPAYEKMTGYSTLDFDGQQPVRFAKETEEDRATLAKIVADMDQGRPTQARLWAYKKDGSRHLRDIQNSPVRDDDGTITHWISVGRDVTQEVKDQQELHLFKRAMEQSPTAITIVEEQDGDIPRVAFVNDSIERMHGFSKGAITGKSASLFVSEGRISPELAESMKAARSRGEAVDTDGYFKRPDGSDGWLSLRYAPVRDDRNVITHWISYGADITEQHDTDQQRRILERALECSPTAVTVVESLPDQILKFVYVNPAYEAMSGYRASDIIGQPFCLVDQSPSVRSGIAVPTGDQPITYIGEGTRCDSTRYVRETKSAAFRDTSGQKTHTIMLSNDITARIKDEQRMRMLDLAVDQADSAIAVWDVTPAGLRMVYMNAAYENMTGYAPEDLIGKPPETLASRRGSDTKSAAALEHAMKTGTPAVITSETQRKDGRWFVREIEINPVFDSAGIVTSWVGISRDVTAKRLYDERMQKLELVFEQSDSAISIVDVVNGETRVSFINPAFEKMTGYLRDELIGESPDIILNRDHGAPGAMNGWLQALRDGVAKNVTVETQRKDGTWFVRELEFAPARDSNGDIISWIGHSRDITEKRANEQRLRSLKMAFEQADSAISVMTVAETGNLIAFVNGAYERMMGYTRDEVIGTTAGFLKNRDFHEPRVMESWIEAVRQGRAVSFTIETQRKDGAWFVRDVESNPVRDSDGTIISWISVSRDVTQKLKDEQRMRTLQMAFEQTDSAISIMDTSDSGHIFVYVNQAFETMSGYAREEVIGSRSNFLENRDFIEVGALDRWKSAVQRGESVALTLKTQHKDGS